MIKTLRTLLERGLEKRVPVTGLGIFRILFGLVALQEIVFLGYFRHLIFDRLPFLEPASPVIDLFLTIWAVVALCIVVGYRTRLAMIVNYVLWLVFVGFTPMWLDFDGGFDQMMVGISFLMLFLPTERALSLDNLRGKLKYSAPGRFWAPPDRVSVLCYTLPLATVLGLLYLDAGIHKLSAEFWRNGMGAWLPPSHPYYMSGLDMSWLLDQQYVERAIGYTIIVFQFLFLPLFWFRWARVPLLLLGGALHVGIIVSLNIYQFGFGMLAPYALLVPFSWWRKAAGLLRRAKPSLVVLYDELCPLCNRTVIVLSHFDVTKSIDFKGLQSHAKEYRPLDGLPEAELLKDLYALDTQGRRFAGFDTYLRILTAMIYPAPVAWLLRIPGFYHIGKTCYRRIADARARLTCDESCTVPPVNPKEEPLSRYWAELMGSRRQQATRLAKFLVLVMFLQLNSTLQFGVFYRLNEGHARSEIGQVLEGASNAVLFLSHTFLGITPHALYMHDHFKGYTRILAVAWRDAQGQERWLPFVNEEGRIIAPNWGRIQCWWANIAVTPHIHRRRLDKALMQLTAFWGSKMGADLRHAEFTIKLKEVRVPMDWQPGLRAYNLSQPWRDIGRVVWEDGFARVEIPGLDREAL